MHGGAGSIGRCTARRAARRLAGTLALLGVLLVPVAPSLAQPPPGHGGIGPRGGAAGAAERQMPQRGGYDERRQERREDMRQERQQQRDERMQQRREFMERRERMTPDERRNLRRDLNDAGRDLYRR
jgi:hypothetical protein